MTLLLRHVPATSLYVHVYVINTSTTTLLCVTCITSQKSVNFLVIPVCVLFRPGNYHVGLSRTTCRFFPKTRLGKGIPQGSRLSHMMFTVSVAKLFQIKEVPVPRRCGPEIIAWLTPSSLLPIRPTPSRPSRIVWFVGMSEFVIVGTTTPTSHSSMVQAEISSRLLMAVRNLGESFTITWNGYANQIHRALLNIKISSYQYRNSHHKDNMVSWSSYLYYGITTSEKTVFILRRGPAVVSKKIQRCHDQEPRSQSYQQALFTSQIDYCYSLIK